MGLPGLSSNWAAPPWNSIKVLYLQLRDQGGMPLSENIYINTYNDCSRNMVFITFRENK